MQSFSGTWYLVLFAFLTATAYAGGLYYKNRRDELANGWRFLLAGIRFGFVFFICFLFFSPLVKLKQERIEKPLCFLSLDQSSSMRGAFDTILLTQEFKSLSRKLSKKFDVRLLGFGQNACSEPDFIFNSPATDFSRLFELVGQQNTDNDHAVVVLVSDGNNNTGQEPLTAFRRIALPLYTVGIGDTNLYPDIFISQALANLYAYKGNTFPLQVRLGQHHAPQAVANLSLRKAYGDKNKLKDTVISFQGLQEQGVEWNIETRDSGICRYVLELEPLKNEHNLQNNIRRFSVNILENRQKILILAHAPHPDLGCLRQSLQRHEKYQIDMVLAKNLADLTKKTARLESYDLVILHGLPSNRYPLHELTPILNRKNLFYMFTASTSWQALDHRNSGITVQPRSSKWNEAQAHFNTGFGLFNVPAQERILWEKFPPLQTPFAFFNAVPGGQTLFYQSILQVPTSDPLLWISPPGNRRTAVCCGTNLWRWRLADFQAENNSGSFDILLDKCLQLLCHAKPESNLTVHCPSTLHTTESLSVKAYLYNASFEKVEDAPIRFTMTRQEDKTEYIFDFVPENDHYTLNAGFLPEGEYLYMAQATVGDEEYLTQGGLSITDPQLENPRLPADHALLRNLALTYQGRFFYAGRSAEENPEVWKALAQELLQRQDLKPYIKTEESYISPLERKWILIVLLAFLSFEYFARKRFGNL